MEVCMEGYIVVFEYGQAWDRSPLKGLGVVDETRCHKGQEYWHVKPVFWSQGSPLPRWVEAGSVAVLNAETLAFARAS
jgi:hypothetical protein